MLGAVDQGYLFELLDALSRQEGANILAIADRMAERSLSFDAALQDLGVLLHQIALAQTVPEALSDDVPEKARIEALAKAFGVEEVQLYYQIALHGRKDLYLAPDEYAGFSMTLLRMLSFRPEAQALADAAPRATAQKKTDVEAVAPRAAAPETRAAAPAQNREFSGDWVNLVNQLKLGGMAKMLAQHCELARQEGDLLALTLPPEHKHLAEKTYQEKLKSALSDYFGKPMRVNIELGATTGPTPVQVQQSEKAAQEKRAIESIEQDPFVRDLVEQFDAKVIESTIKPLQT